MQCVCVCVCVCVCAQDNADKLTHRLLRTVFTDWLWQEPHPIGPFPFEVSCHCDHPSQLSVLQLIRIQTQRPRQLNIHDLDIGTIDTVAALQGLPDYFSGLHLDFCACSASLAKIRSLGRALSSSMKGIDIHSCLCHAGLLSFCAGLNERRAAAEGAGDVVVYVSTWEGEDEKVGEHVVVTGEKKCMWRALFGK